MNVSDLNAQVREADQNVTKWTNVKRLALEMIATLGGAVPVSTGGKRRGRPKGSGRKSVAVADGSVAAVTEPSDGKRSAGRPLSEGSLRASIVKVLEGKPDGMGIRQIAEAVKATGYKSNSQSFDKQVATALIKGEFERVSHGTYKLKGNNELPKSEPADAAAEA